MVLRIACVASVASVIAYTCAGTAEKPIAPRGKFCSSSRAVR